MMSTPEAGTFAAAIIEADKALTEARAQFREFEMSMDTTQHSQARQELRIARTLAIEFVRQVAALNDELDNLLEASAPLGVWVWACTDPEASPLQGDSADNFAGAYVRHFPSDAAARRWLVSPDRDDYLVGEEAAPLFLVNHGTITAVWGFGE